MTSIFNNVFSAGGNITVNGKKINIPKGKSFSFVNGKIYVDGVEFKEGSEEIEKCTSKQVELKFENCHIQTFTSSSSETTYITSSTVSHISTTNGDIDISGNILGYASTTNGDIKCHDIMAYASTVNGDIKTEVKLPKSKKRTTRHDPSYSSIHIGNVYTSSSSSSSSSSKRPSKKQQKTSDHDDKKPLKASEKVQMPTVKDLD